MQCRCVCRVVFRLSDGLRSAVYLLFIRKILKRCSGPAVWQCVMLCMSMLWDTHTHTHTHTLYLWVCAAAVQRLDSVAHTNQCDSFPADAWCCLNVWDEFAFLPSEDRINHVHLFGFCQIKKVWKVVKFTTLCIYISPTTARPRVKQKMHTALIAR